MSTEGARLTNVVAPRRGVPQYLVELWHYRELLAGLVRKQLKVKYKNSALGFVWSMLNPAMYLVIFWVVFELVLKAGIPDFAIFLLSGLLVWNFFAVAVSEATPVITGNASLVNKVWFPRAVLPLASVGAALVHFFLQAVVLVLALGGLRYDVDVEWLPLLIPTLAVLVLLAAGFGILMAAFNVYARDTQYLVELGLLAWFWLTPIVYQYKLVSDRLASGPLPGWLALANPVTPIVLVFQRAIYGNVGGAGTGGGRLAGVESSGILPDASMLWYLRNVAVVGVAAAVLFVVALRFFERVEGDFAEEL